MTQTDPDLRPADRARLQRSGAVLDEAVEEPSVPELDPVLTSEVEAREAKKRASMFAALAVPNYRIYVSGSFLSNIGTWMQRVAQDWLVLELSGGSGLAVGITTALQFVPTMLLSAYGGVIADRFDKRLVLKITQSWMAICAATLGVLAITGVAQTWHVYLLALLFGLGTAFDVPARQSFVSEVVGKDRIANAIGLNSATFHAARIIGPAVAGLVIAAWGSGWAILTNAVTYLAFLAVLVLMDSSKLQLMEPVARAKHQLRAGIAYVRGRSDIMLVLGVVFFVGTFGMNFQMTSALMAQQEFHRGAADYGLLGTYMAIGSLAGALLAARRRKAPRARFIVSMAVIFGMIEVVAGLMPTYGSYAAVLPVMGFAALMTMTASNACIQMGVDPKFRGRVMALYAMVMMGGTPIGSPILGWVGQVFGARWTLIIGGALCAIGALGTAFVLARKQRLGATVVLRPRPHLDVQRKAA